MKKLQYIIIASLLLFVFGCEVKYDDFEPASGNADLSVFVAIGDSYTAGYTDGALFKEGQENSYASILADQINKVDTIEWKLPLIEDNKSIGVPPYGKYELAIVNGALSPVPVAGDTELLTDPTNWVNGNAPYHNVGVPAAKAIHLVSSQFGDYTLGEGNFNPYYSRFASAPGTSTVIGDALLNQPTFFTYWAGIYDVLDYAINGGIGNTDGLSSGDITNVTAFTQAFKGAMALIVVQADKGALANIPDVTAFPYFNTIAYNNLTLSADQASTLNAAYTAYNQGATAYGLATIEFKEGANAFVVADENHPLGRRQMQEGELVLLSAQTAILSASMYGSAEPLTDVMFLTVAEIQSIKDATAQFNAIIEDEAETRSLALVDVEAWYQNLYKGIVVDGNSYSSSFVTGGFFSLDGLHPTQRGAAMLANAFIKSINKQYGAAIPEAMSNDFPTVTYP